MADQKKRPGLLPKGNESQESQNFVQMTKQQAVYTKDTKTLGTGGGEAVKASHFKSHGDGMTDWGDSKKPAGMYIPALVETRGKGGKG